MELRDEFNKHGFLLTAAVSAAGTYISSSYDVGQMSRYVIFIYFKLVYKCFLAIRYGSSSSVHHFFI